MKRNIALVLICIIFALSIAGCGGAKPEGNTEASGSGETTAAEDTGVPQELTDVLVGEWQEVNQQRAVMDILPGEYVGEGDFVITISWASSYNERDFWEMNADYDPGTGKLTYTNGRKSDQVFDDEGNSSKETVLWEDAQGTFTLTDGKLYWEDSKEENTADLAFERTYAGDVTVEELKKNLFDVFAEEESGTAGSSLKDAQGAFTVLYFASARRIWNADAKALEAAMREAWDSMSEEEKTAFRTNFSAEDGIAGLIAGTLNDYTAVKDVFDDAGLGKEMSALSEDIYTRCSWNALYRQVVKLEEKQ